MVFKKEYGLSQRLSGTASISNLNAFLSPSSLGAWPW